MTALAQKCGLTSQIELYFDLYNDDDFDAMYNLCGRLKDESMFFQGLYHYHTLIKMESGRFDHDCENVLERNQDAFEIFEAVGNSSVETIETYYAWYMMGKCYESGIGTYKNTSQAHEYLKKAAEKELPVACWDLGSMHILNGHLEEGLCLWEKTAESGYRYFIDELVQLYVLNKQMQDFDKACYWASKANNLNFYSRSRLRTMLASCQIEWIQKYHLCWVHLDLELSRKNVPYDSCIFGIDRIAFTDQVFVILLISKFRSQSRFKFTSLLTKDVGLSIIKQLAKLWLIFVEQPCHPFYRPCYPFYRP